MTLRVIYRAGRFVPEDECQIEEGTPGIVVIERVVDRPTESQIVSSPEERRRLLAELVERMKSNPLPPESPRLTREQMHDRA